MNTRVTPALRVSLEEQCINALRELPEVDGFPTAQMALYQRLEAIEDPLQWQEQEDDAQTSVGLWKTLESQGSLSIQIAAISASLRGLRAVAACPTDGYI